MMSTGSMTTGEAEAYRAGQATIRERHMLALTYLRTAINTRDVGVRGAMLERAYASLGGVSSGEPAAGAGGALNYHGGDPRKHPLHNPLPPTDARQPWEVFRDFCS